MNSNIVLPGFEEVIINKTEVIEGTLCLYVEMPVSKHTCPTCGKHTMKVHDYRIQKIKHLKMFERNTLIFYRKRRYTCLCGKRFPENNPFINRYQRLSTEYNQAITIRSIKGKTFKETAEIYGTSASTIVRRFDKVAEDTVQEEPNALPKVIAIDEYKGDTKEGKYQLIIADGVTREPIDILPNRYMRQ
ncbi:transposase, partial [Bacillus coahuilensis p1.1.43]